MPEFFQVTYQMPGQPVVTERGLTAAGVQSLQNTILRGRGWGCVQRMAAVEKSEREDRFEAACAANRRGARERHDAYCNQMPRARGYAA